ncbi:Rap1a/Tai family immunity protein [Mesorhizobium helmanticense]|uniref:Rap1a immunity protein domain-containing protein n=1 Tax=Mesorhizobium helmanticense TaxID=1776423 RepID=A0A2T4J119_9HYPH|nr:Rap1a/Tai family immunity protein [Mesorhizobium helmanticense]PTE11528.1 hypothetical protein C9427_04720 [Mesorhizobium helmanticense]
MRAKSVTASALLMLSTLSAQAGFFTGNELHGFCTGQGSFALAYIMGAADTINIDILGIDKKTGQKFEQQRFICVPPGATGGQVRDVACKYLSDHPEDRQLPATWLVYRALLIAWPCAQ